MLLLFLFRLTGVAASRMSEYTLLNGINLTSGFERYSNLVLRVLFLEPGNKIHLQRVSWSRTMSSFYGNSSHCHAALNTYPFGVTKRPKYAELNVEFFRLFFLLKRFNSALMFPIKLEIIFLILIVAFEACHGILGKTISVLVKLFSSIFCLKGLDEAVELTENGLTQHWEKEGRIEKNIKRFVCSIRGFRCRSDVEPEQKRKKNSQRNGSRTDLSKMADLASERVL